VNYDESKRLLTRRELAEYLRMHAETITRKARAGEIPAYVSGTRTMRFDLDEVKRAMRRGRTKRASRRQS
jgi:excisionase family DNA binding protein